MPINHRYGYSISTSTLWLGMPQTFGYCESVLQACITLGELKNSFWFYKGEEQILNGDSSNKDQVFLRNCLNNRAIQVFDFSQILNYIKCRLLEPEAEGPKDTVKIFPITCLFKSGPEWTVEGAILKYILSRGSGNFQEHSNHCSLFFQHSRAKEVWPARCISLGVSWREYCKNPKLRCWLPGIR